VNLCSIAMRENTMRGVLQVVLQMTRDRSVRREYD